MATMRLRRRDGSGGSSSSTLSAIVLVTLTMHCLTTRSRAAPAVIPSASQIELETLADAPLPPLLSSASASAQIKEPRLTYQDVDPLIVRTKKGLVKGTRLLLPTGKSVDVWLGIPYAMPPIHYLRFRHPRPTESWDGVFNATKQPNCCFQIVDKFFGNFSGSDMWNPNTNLSEDCLYLNVWSPTPRPQNATVMVWIYGGGFFAGSVTLDVYDPRYLVAEENVIFVAMQYRVASLGFLYFNTAEAPGNAGMYDQLMALQWVRDNVAAFGGDPERITLFGESAGAVSVSLHLISSLSRNLFQRAILQSGTALSQWAVLSRHELIRRGLLLAQAVGCPHDVNYLEEVLDCLKDTDAKALVESEGGTSQVVDFSFVPVIDGTFLDESPIKSLETRNFKRCNLLAGSNTDEGYYFIVYYLTELFRREDNIYVSRADFVESVRKLFPTYNSIVHQAIIYRYTNWLDKDDPAKNRDGLDKMVGDYHFTCGTNTFAFKFALAKSKVFMYHFAHRSTIHKWPLWMNVLHADEINFVLGEPLNPSLKYHPTEVDLSRRIMRYWANFAKTGNPSISPDGTLTRTYWPVHTIYGREFLTLSTNSSAVGKGFRLEQCAFWNKYIPQLAAATQKLYDEDGESGNPSGGNKTRCTGGSNSAFFVRLPVLAISLFFLTTHWTLLRQLLSLSTSTP